MRRNHSQTCCAVNDFPDLRSVFGKRAFISYALGAEKPDERAFAAVLEALQTDAAATLLVDDSARYVEGARMAGLSAHHFRGISGFREFLALHGVS